MMFVMVAAMFMFGCSKFDDLFGGCDCNDKCPHCNHAPNDDGEEPEEPQDPEAPETPDTPEEPEYYCDALLPDEDYGRDEMKALLELVESQEGEIDDKFFEERIVSAIFDCTDRFMLDNPEQWSWAMEYVGRNMFDRVRFDADGTYLHRGDYGCSLVGNDAYERLLDEGHIGWHHKDTWHYEAETNTLVTSLGEDYELRAEVLYFDGTRAVLLGHVGGLSFIAYDDDGGSIAFNKELFRISFLSDGRDTYLDGYALTYEEYMALFNEYSAQ